MPKSKRIIDYDLTNDDDYENKLFKAIERVINNKHVRTSKIKKKVEEIRSHSFKGFNVYFVTFTYSNEYINDFDKLKNKGFKRFLQQYTLSYIGNDDIGKNTHRNHHHALISTWLSEDELKQLWIYGFTDFKTVPKEVTNYIKVKNYIAKLTNHALKEGVSNIRMTDNTEKNIVAYAYDLDVPLSIVE